MTWLVSEARVVPVAGTATDCGGTGEDAGSAAFVVIALAPLPDVVGTTIFPILLVFTEPSLPVLVFGAGSPEVASPPADD